MRYCNNKTLQEFMEKLVKEIKFENKRRESDDMLDVPFLISVLCQDFNKHEKTYAQFISDLENYDYDVSITQTENDYNGICKAIVYFYNEKYGWLFDEKINFQYEIEFVINERFYGYCKCKPNDLGYREDKCCCGYDCDWYSPEFTMRKSFFVSNQTWVGYEHDYWDFEDEFYKEDKKENEEKLIREREIKIKNLEEAIKNAKKELKKLEKF